MAVDQKSTISSYKKQESALKSKISGSSSYSSNTSPNDYDISNQIALKKLQAKRQSAEDELLKKQWYGETEKTASAPKSSMLERGLTLLSLPNYAMVGAAEAVTGKGTTPGVKNIIENIKEKETFGDLLTKFNVPNTVAAPMGFALDIATDPLNWVTVGTAALVPRVAKGLIKGGTKGAVKGLSSSLAAKTVAGVAKRTPYLKNLEKVKGLVSGVAKAGGEYNTIIGRDVGKELAERASKYETGQLLGQQIRSTLEESKIGKSFVSAIWPEKDWLKNSLDQDAKVASEIISGERVVGDRNIINRARELTGSGIFNRLDDAASKLEELGPEGYKKYRAVQLIDEGALAATDAAKHTKFIDPDDAARALEGELENDRLVNEALQITAKNTDANYIDEVLDESGALAGESPTYEQIMGATKSTIKELSRQKTDVGWYDTMADWFRDIKVKDVPIGEKIADSYNVYMGLFKTGKIGGNLIGAMTRAIVGNHTMGMMSGLDGWKPEYQKKVMDSIRMINGWMDAESTSKFINESFFKNPKWVDTLSRNPQTFQSVFGVHPSFFNGSSTKIADDIFKNAKAAGVDVGEISLKDLSSHIDALKKSGLGIDIRKAKAPTPQGIISSLAERDSDQLVKTGFYAEELMGGAFQQLIKEVEKKAAKGGASWKLLDWYLKRPMSIYSSADGGFKLGYALQMTNKGLTEKEISMLSRFYPTIGKGAELDKATNLWKIDPNEALGAVQEIFMNYATMPGAVKVLRSLPLLGAPFGSFMYGMGVKAGKTAVYNPAIFSKINYFLKEFQGDKTPLERQQLSSPYYSWYNKDGMVKLPFFQENPVYLNVADMIPYYTMNMLQPTERQYDEFMPSTITAIFDKLPIFQQPEGQVLLDYFILPTILRESNPQGRFGQPLWKTDSNLLEKFGYATRSFAETPLPTLAGVAGVPGGIVAPGATEYVPSFRYRQLSNAVQGKSSLGISGQEDPLARTIRVLSGVFGLPWYRMNLSYTQK